MSRRKARRPRPAREAALEIVARRMLSLAELRKRLERRGYGIDEIDEATELAHSYGYVDDAKLAGAVVREAARTTRGPRWVRSTLIRRGVPEQLAREAEALALEGASDCIREVIARRFGDALDDSGRQKAYRYLLSRGFSPETVLEVLDEAN